MQDVDSLVYWVALQAVPGLGPVTYRKLLSRFGGPKAVLEASKRDLNSLPWLRHTLINKIIRLRDKKREITRLIEGLYKGGTKVVTLLDKDYPSRLKGLKNSPVVLYVRGEYLDSDQRAVGIVGTTRPSERGYFIAQGLAQRLAQRGVTIISGYARGIDTASHIGALMAGGRTIMVIPMGIHHFYWRKEFSPYIYNEESYIILSEGLPGQAWQKGAALSRNRLIAGLSKAVIVVETDVQGGALHTCAFARKMSVPTYALRYRRPPPSARGNEQLIAQGAISISSFKDVDKIVACL